MASFGIQLPSGLGFNFGGGRGKNWFEDDSNWQRYIDAQAHNQRWQSKENALDRELRRGQDFGGHSFDRYNTDANILAEYGSDAFGGRPHPGMTNDYAFGRDPEQERKVLSGIRGY